MMPGADERELPGLDTFPGLVLALTALSGELPAALVSRLPAADTYKEYAVKQLKRDNLLRTFYRNGVRGLRLTTAAKRRLVACWPNQFLSYLSGRTETNQLKSEVARRLRLHRMAEVLVTMLNADVSVLPWEKPVLFSPTPPDGSLALARPTYYSSREVKELGEQAVKIRGSRSTGVLLAGGDIFIIYNTGPGQMKWEYKAEMRLKALLEMELCQTRLPAQFMRARQAAIVFAADMGQMAPLMGVGGDKRHNYFVLDGNFEHFYYLPSDHHGEVILQLLCDPGEKAVLDGILCKGFGPARPGWLAEHDAMDGERAVLLAYTCDLPRIRRFNAALERMGRTGTLFCFDFQADAMRQVCGPGVDIQCIDFDAYERSVFLSPESN